MSRRNVSRRIVSALFLAGIAAWVWVLVADFTNEPDKPAHRAPPAATIHHGAFCWRVDLRPAATRLGTSVAHAFDQKPEVFHDKPQRDGCSIRLANGRHFDLAVSRSNVSTRTFDRRYATYSSVHRNCTVQNTTHVAPAEYSLECSWPTFSGFGYVMVVHRAELQCLLFSEPAISRRDRKTVGQACRTFVRAVTR